MPDDITILSLRDRDRWEAAHHHGGLPSQSWSYAWGLSASGIDPRLAIVRCRGTRMLLPYFERSWMGTTDISTVPGLSGASISSGSSAPLALWSEYARSRHWVAGYIQLAASASLDEIPPGAVLVTHTAVFVFDLLHWNPAKASSQTVRKKISDARQRGAVLERDKALLAESLNRLYRPAMQRRGAALLFSAETLSRWVNSPGTLLLGVRLGGEIVAVHLGHIHGEWCEWHIAATTEEGRSLAAMIFWDAAEILRGLGVRFYNMGGGIRIGDGIYQFKKRLGGVPTPLQSVRQIYDEAKYSELSQGRGSSLNHWFPAYRNGHQA